MVIRGKIALQAVADLVTFSVYREADDDVVKVHFIPDVPVYGTQLVDRTIFLESRAGEEADYVVKATLI